MIIIATRFGANIPKSAPDLEMLWREMPVSIPGVVWSGDKFCCWAKKIQKRLNLAQREAN